MGRIDIDYVGQDLVLDLDQLEGCLGDLDGCGGNRRDSVTVIEHLLRAP